MSRGLDLLDSVDAKVEGFNDLFLSFLNEHAPIKTVKVKSTSAPFITDGIRKLISTRNDLHKIARQSGYVEDWNAFKRHRRGVKLAIKNAETAYFNNQILANKKNSSSLWKTIRAALPKLRPNPEYTKNTSILAEEFNNFFTSVGEKASDASERLAEMYDLPATPAAQNSWLPELCQEDLFEFKPVLSSDVRKAIMDIPNNKAPGYDKVPASVMKDCLHHILPTITSIINLSWESSTFPRAWKQAEIIPHLKEGDHEEPNNNRPISLLPVLSKVAEKLAIQQYASWLSDKNRLTRHQSGNRKLHSAETLGLLVADHGFSAIDERKITAMVLIDLSKAFDSICHTTLIGKLHALGTSTHALNWFRSYLTNRKQTTRVGTSLSPSSTVTHGVPQGSILGPILFSVYMNDLPNAIKNCSIESYFDDAKLFLSFGIKERETALSQLTQDLNRVASWCCTNRLLINPQKTKLMLFGTRQLTGRVSDIAIPFLGKTLSPSNSCKDLGIVFDKHLSFNDHTDYLTSSLLGKLCQINRVRHLLTKEALLITLNALVLSKLFYCSTVWSGTTQQNIGKLQILQNFAARILAGKRKYDHIWPSLKELKWLPIKEMLRLRDVTMVFKCLHGLAPKYLESKLAKRSAIHRHNTRRKNDINITLKRTSTAQRSFFNHAISSWNNLSSATKNCTSVPIFKRQARKELWARSRGNEWPAASLYSPLF